MYETEGERLLLEELQSGHVDLTNFDEGNRIVRAKFLESLLEHTELKSNINSKMLELIGLDVRGEFNLSYLEISLPIKFSNCSFEDIILEETKLKSLIFEEGKNSSIKASGMKLTGNLSFNKIESKDIILDRCNVDGNLNVIDCSLAFLSAKGLQIGGDVNITNTTISANNDNQIAFEGRNIYIKGQLNIRSNQENEKTIIEGTIYLPKAKIGGGISFSNLDIQKGVNLRDAEIGGDVNITNTTISANNDNQIAFEGRNIYIKGQLNIRSNQENEKTIIEGTIYLLRAIIDGTVFFTNLNLQKGADLQYAKVGRSVTITNTTISANNDNQIAFDGRNIYIKGQLNIRSNQENEKTIIEGTIYLLRAIIDGTVFFTNLNLQKGVNLKYAKVGRSVNITNTTISANNDNQIAFDGEYIHIKGRLSIISNQENEKTIIEGTIYLQRAKIDGTVFFTNLNLQKGVNLHYAEIGGNVQIGNSNIETIPNNSYKRAFNGGGMHIKGDLFCVDTTIKGNLALISAKIDQDVYFKSDKKESIIEGIPNDNHVAYAIMARDLEVGITLRFMSGFKAIGNIYLKNAKINSSLLIKCDKIEGEVVLENTHTEVVEINYKKLKSWDPEKVKLKINGFRYDKLGDNHITKNGHKVRINFLEDFLERFMDKKERSPQPYYQLAKVLSMSGYENEANEVLIRKEEYYIRRELYEKHNLGIRRFFNLEYYKLLAKKWVWGKIAGYGYDPLRVLWLMIGFLLTGFVIFYLANKSGFIVPADVNVLLSHEYQKYGVLIGVPKGYPSFNPFVYSLNDIIPIINLYQTEYWIPNTNTFWGSIVMVWLWIEIISGWVLTSIFVVAISGLAQRNPFRS